MFPKWFLSSFIHSLNVNQACQNTTFHSLLEQVLAAFTSKVGQVIGAERATLYLVDDKQRELWARVAPTASSITVAELTEAPARHAAVSRDATAAIRILTSCTPLRVATGGLFTSAYLDPRLGW